MVMVMQFKCEACENGDCSNCLQKSNPVSKDGEMIFGGVLCPCRHESLTPQKQVR